MQLSSSLSRALTGDRTSRMTYSLIAPEEYAAGHASMAGRGRGYVLRGGTLRSTVVHLNPSSALGRDAPRRGTHSRTALASAHPLYHSRGTYPAVLYTAKEYVLDSKERGGTLRSTGAPHTNRRALCRDAPRRGTICCYHHAIASHRSALLQCLIQRSRELRATVNAWLPASRCAPGGHMPSHALPISAPCETYRCLERGLFHVSLCSRHCCHCVVTADYSVTLAIHGMI